MIAWIWMLSAYISTANIQIAWFDCF